MSMAGTSDLRRRKRPPTDDEDSTPLSDEAPSADHKQHEDIIHQQQSTVGRSIFSFQWWWRWWKAAVVGLAWLVVIVGWILRMNLHTGQECEMTWSVKHFLPIHVPPPLPPSKNQQDIDYYQKMMQWDNPNYRLWKFVDRRDPRHRKLLPKKDEEQEAPLQGSDWCGKLPPNQTQAVIYIPGHWGSYKQARSLGAHGIQLTVKNASKKLQRKVLQALANNEWTGDAEVDGRFVFDVYALDFQEQGGALHGDFLQAQSYHLSHVVHHIAETCQLDSITLLGHSIGGLVARLAVSQSPTVQNVVENIITLGTPHKSPVFGWESSIHDLYEKYLWQDSTSTVVVSIGGGIRDEMIPPSACQIDKQNSIAILAPNIMHPGPNGTEPTLGMDHRAIVWCSNLLTMVRRIIFTLSHTQRLGLSSSERLRYTKRQLRLMESSTRHHSYPQDLQEHQHDWQKVYGFLPTVAMECAMLYNLELLVAIITFFGCWYFAMISQFLSIFPTSRGTRVTIKKRETTSRFSSLPSPVLVFTIILTSVVVRLTSNFQISSASILILTIVAHSILWGIHWVVYFCLVRMKSGSDDGIDKENEPALLPTTIMVLRLGLWNGMWLVLFLGSIQGMWIIYQSLFMTHWKKLPWNATIYIASSVFVYLMSVSKIHVTFQKKRPRKKRGEGYRQQMMEQEVVFVSMLLLILPFLVAGQFVAFFSFVDENVQAPIPSSYNLFQISSFTIVLSMGIRQFASQICWQQQQQRHFVLLEKSKKENRIEILKAYNYRQWVTKNIRTVLMLLAMIRWCWSLFRMGNGVCVGYLVSNICWIDIVMCAVQVWTS